MNLWQSASKIPHGAEQISEWLGSGGNAVDPATAQRRADICLKCPHNQPGLNVTKAVALAVRSFLDLKNKLKLRVKGEKSLGACDICTCQLRLQVHEPQELVVLGLTPEEMEKLPEFCWKKIKVPTAE
jgi:hypothetical protein